MKDKVKSACGVAFLAIASVLYIGANMYEAPPITCHHCGSEDGCEYGLPLVQDGWEHCDFNYGQTPPCMVWGQFGPCEFY